MALTIRLPEGLHRLAVDMAEDRGISLNALIAVALSDYVRQRRVAIIQPPPQEPVKHAVARPAVPVGGSGPSRQQRRRAERLAKKRRGG